MALTKWENWEQMAQKLQKCPQDPVSPFFLFAGHLSPVFPVRPFHVSALVAQCSATPASVAATPPCSATPFQRQLDVRHSWQFKGDRCDRAVYRGCSAILLLHLKNPRILRKSAATRVARQGVPAHVCNYGFCLLFPVSPGGQALTFFRAHAVPSHHPILRMIVNILQSFGARHKTQPPHRCNHNRRNSCKSKQSIYFSS